MDLGLFFISSFSLVFPKSTTRRDFYA